MNKKRYFLEGQAIYLRAPDIQADIMEGEWHQWFNDPQTTRFLSHGIYPVSREEEADLIRTEMKDPTSLILAIVASENDRLTGVISLKSIDFLNHTAEIAIVTGRRPVLGGALEAMALLTKHGFERLNLMRIYAGQHEGLWQWVNSLELIGYRLEGYQENAGIRGSEPFGSVSMSVTADRFRELEAARGGVILTSSMIDLLKSRRRENMVTKIRAAINSIYD